MSTYRIGIIKERLVVFDLGIRLIKGDESARILMLFLQSGGNPFTEEINYQEARARLRRLEEQQKKDTIAWLKDWFSNP